MTTSSPATPAVGVPVTRIVAVLLAAATTILVFRIPGAVIVSALAPLIVLGLTGLYRPRRQSAPLWAFLGLAVASACVAVLLADAEVPWVNYASLALVFTVFGVAILATGAGISATRAVMSTLYVTFALTLLIGWAEVVSGFKLQTILYPASANLRIPGRFYVAAYFPNYNDFGVVVAMFAIMALARFLFDPKGPWVQASRLLATASGAVLIVAGGSRGALGGLLIGCALVVFMSVRATRSRPLPGIPILVLGLLGAAGTLYIWSLPVIQDNSTQARGRIVDNSIQLSLEHPTTLLFGWGYQDAFDAAAKLAYPDTLMDPHNLLLELFTWFGLPTLLAFVVLWLSVCYRGIWLMELREHWTAITAVLLFTLTPVLGIVPSSSLRYYYVFLLAACAVSAITQPERRLLK